MYEGHPTAPGDLADQAIAAAIAAGDPAGLPAAYNRYAAGLHAYCHTLLGEGAGAADAVQDTFIIAAARLAGLRDASRLRPWLYAVARNECHRLLRARPAAVRPAEAAAETEVLPTAGASAQPTAGASAQEHDLREFAQAALHCLDPAEQEIIDLKLRHELDGADLACVLGVPAAHGHGLAARAVAHFEAAASVLTVARTGGGYCAELAAILAGWDGKLTAAVRARASRHIQRCETCAARGHPEQSPVMLVSLIPLISLPPGLQQRVLRLAEDTRPGAAGYRALAVQRAGRFRRDGFPVPVAPPRVRARRENPALAAAAAAAVVVVLGGGVFAAGMLAHHPGHHAAGVLAAGTPAPVLPPTATAVSSPAATPPSPLQYHRDPAASADPPPAAAAAASLSPAATIAAPRPLSPSSSPPRAKPKETVTPRPSPGTLAVSPTSVQLAQNTTNGPYTGKFTITANGGPVDFTITNPAPNEFTLSKDHGSIPAGGTATITVTAPATPPSGSPTSVTLTVNPGGLSVTVSYPPGS